MNAKEAWDISERLATVFLDVDVITEQIVKTQASRWKSWPASVVARRHIGRIPHHSRCGHWQKRKARNVWCSLTIEDKRLAYYTGRDAIPVLYEELITCCRCDAPIAATLPGKKPDLFRRQSFHMTMGFALELAYDWISIKAPKPWSPDYMRKPIEILPEVTEVTQWQEKNSARRKKIAGRETATAHA